MKKENQKNLIEEINKKIKELGVFMIYQMKETNATKSSVKQELDGKYGRFEVELKVKKLDPPQQ